MADTPVVVFGPAEPSTSNDTTTFTAPSGETMVVRQLHISNPTGSAATFTIGTATGTSATCVWEAFSIPAGNTFDWTGFWVVASGTTFFIKQGTANALTVTAWGVEVT